MGGVRLSPESVSSSSEENKLRRESRSLSLSISSKERVFPFSLRVYRSFPAGIKQVSFSSVSPSSGRRLIWGCYLESYRGCIPFVHFPRLLPDYIFLRLFRSISAYYPEGGPTEHKKLVWAETCVVL